MTTMTYTGRLTIATCWCGIVYALPESLEREAKEKGKATYCPLGHSGVYRVTETERLKAELVRERSRRDQAEAEAEHQRRVAIGTKGALVKQRKRIAKGVCPCCNRQFVNVERHMTSKHPGYGDGGA